jgi:hypothetical protein
MDSSNGRTSDIGLEKLYGRWNTYKEHIKIDYEFVEVYRNEIVNYQSLIDQVEYLTKRNARLDKENEGLLTMNSNLEQITAKLQNNLFENDSIMV